MENRKYNLRISKRCLGEETENSINLRLTKQDLTYLMEQIRDFFAVSPTKPTNSPDKDLDIMRSLARDKFHNDNFR